jgi:hypothetical protein
MRLTEENCCLSEARGFTTVEMSIVIFQVVTQRHNPENRRQLFLSRFQNCRLTPKQPSCWVSRSTVQETEEKEQEKGCILIMCIKDTCKYLQRTYRPRRKTTSPDKMLMTMMMIMFYSLVELSLIFYKWNYYTCNFLHATGPSRVASSIRNFLWNPNVHNRVSKNPQLEPILRYSNQFTPLHRICSLHNTLQFDYTLKLLIWKFNNLEFLKCLSSLFQRPTFLS